MKALVATALLTILLGCGGGAPAPKEAAIERPVPVAAPVKVDDPRPVIVAFGDSLTAGYGVDPGLAYPEVVQGLLNDRGLKYRVVNAGISGDTTSGGLDRVGIALENKPVIAIVELGGNDGLRGLPLATTRENLSKIIEAFQGAGAKVLLAGMTLPRNYGPEYIAGFEKIYKDLSVKYKTGLIPFLLSDVVLKPGMMQGDMIHPTAAGHKKVGALVMRYLEPMVK